MNLCLRLSIKIGRDYDVAPGGAAGDAFWCLAEAPVNDQDRLIGAAINSGSKLLHGCDAVNG